MIASRTNTGSSPRGAKPRGGSRHQPEQTRCAIMSAALKEFADKGLAGARIDTIARSAGVNKALLYYYFQDKDSLYAAVLHDFFQGLMNRLGGVLDAPTSYRERILTYIAAHFDYVASSPHYPRLTLAEMSRPGEAPAPLLREVAEQYLKPIFRKLVGVIQGGIEAGEFREVDPTQFVPSMIGLVVFYFLTPIPRLFGIDPYDPEQVARRRTAVLDFVSKALFVQDSQGMDVIAVRKNDALRTRRKAGASCGVARKKEKNPAKGLKSKGARR